MNLKELQIGDQSFEEMIKANCMYIDKTKEIYKLVKHPRKRYFLSRPRRFGKSLTCSTLDAIFTKDKEFFKDLWIGQSDYIFKQHPIIYFDFSGISHQTPEILIRGLHSALNTHAANYNITLTEKELKEKFAQLIKLLAEKAGPVAIIIDEYDKPITDLIDKPELAERSREELRNFYGTLKDKDIDKNMHFLFITGVSKFAKVSLFSELNNLNDITLDEQYAQIVGYTQHEVEKYLPEHIKLLAEKEKSTYKQTLEKLKTWYNGFRFSKAEITVYNPFSLHRCLSAQDFSNYWFASGTPNFLIKMIAKEPEVVKDFVSKVNWKLAASDMEDFSIEVYYEKIVTLLLQTGYLTIKSYDASPLAKTYTLDYTNLEVRFSMTEQIMDHIAHIPKLKLGELYSRFSDALAHDNINEYCTTLRDYLKLFPHNIIVNRENFFQTSFYGTALMVDPKAILSEVPTSIGYIDIVLHGAKKTFIMEFKKGRSPEVAMKQILAKKYYEQYLITGHDVTLVGINFNLSQKGVNVAWIIKEPIK